MMQKLGTAPDLLYVLTITSGGNYPVPEKGLRVGSQAQQNDIVLPGPYVALHHAIIWVYQGRCYVHDLGSGGITAINGRRITGTVGLRPGDVLTLGNWHLRLSASVVHPAIRPPVVAVRSDPDAAGYPLRWLVVAVATSIVTFTLLLLLALAVQASGVMDITAVPDSAPQTPTALPSPMPTASALIVATATPLPTVTLEGVEQHLSRFKNSPSGEPGAGLRHLGPAGGAIGLSSPG